MTEAKRVWRGERSAAAKMINAGIRDSESFHAVPGGTAPAFWAGSGATAAAPAGIPQQNAPHKTHSAECWPAPTGEREGKLKTPHFLSRAVAQHFVGACSDATRPKQSELAEARRRRAAAPRQTELHVIPNPSTPSQGDGPLRKQGGAAIRIGLAGQSPQSAAPLNAPSVLSRPQWKRDGKFRAAHFPSRTVGTALCRRGNSHPPCRPAAAKRRVPQPRWRHCLAHTAPPLMRGSIKTKPQNSACKAASAALSGLAFHRGALRPSALYLPPCSGFAVLQRFCKTFGFLCRRPLGRSFFAAFDPKSKRNSSILTQ